MNKILLNEVFYFGTIKKIVKDGYMVFFNGKSVFVRDEAKYNLEDGVILGQRDNNYFILSKSNYISKNQKNFSVI